MFPLPSTFQAPTIASGGIRSVAPNGPAIRYTQPPGRRSASAISPGSGFSTSRGRKRFDPFVMMFSLVLDATDRVEISIIKDVDQVRRHWVAGQLNDVCLSACSHDLPGVLRTTD